MTVAEAERKCASMGSCVGMTYRGPPGEHVVQVFFKSTWDLQGGRGSGHTSHRLVACDSGAQGDSFAAPSGFGGSSDDGSRFWRSCLMLFGAFFVAGAVA